VGASEAAHSFGVWKPNEVYTLAERRSTVLCARQPSLSVEDLDESVTWSVYVVNAKVAEPEPEADPMNALS
jgi:hypothetical protein